MQISTCSLCKCLYFSRFLYKHLRIWSQSHQIDSPTFSLKTNGTGPQPVVVASPFPLVRSSMRYWPWKAYRISTWHLARTEKRWGEKAEWTLRVGPHHTLENYTTGSQLKVMKVWSFSSDGFSFWKKDVMFFCFSRWFFGNPEPASFRKEITKKNDMLSSSQVA